MVKYIVLEHEGEEFMVIFPDHPKMTHKHMAEAVSGVRVEHAGGSWEREFRTADVVSAGFIRPSGKCDGYSETLKVGAREYVDDALLNKQR